MTEQIRLRIDSQLALEEYGVTLAQATAAEDSSLAEIETDRTAGKLKAFTGKL